VLLAVLGCFYASMAQAQNPNAACLRPGPVPASCGVIVFDGDSISAGVGASPGQTLDKQFARDLNVPARITNVAVGGRPASECARLFPGLVAPLFQPRARFNLIVFHAGDNDIAHGKSADDAYRSFRQYVAAAHAQGWKIIVSTELQRVDFSPSRQAELASYNKQLLANTAGADAVVDFIADAAFADLTRRDDPALFTKDRIHPSDGGYAVLARMLVVGARPLLPR
jgi:lysophospholipase L1-like esterase